jgi:hypothetical protein
MLTFLPGSHQFGTIWPRVCTFAVLQIVHPLSFVSTAIVERKRTLAMSLVVHEIAHVNATVAIIKTGTRTASHLIVCPATFVFRAIRPSVSTEASLLIVNPITFIIELAVVVFNPRHFAIS